MTVDADKIVGVVVEESSGASEVAVEVFKVAGVVVVEEGSALVTMREAAGMAGAAETVAVA